MQTEAEKRIKELWQRYYKAKQPTRHAQYAIARGDMCVILAISALFLFRVLAAVVTALGPVKMSRAVYITSA